MSPDKIQFENWVPPDARETSTNFYSVLASNFPEEVKVLQRLAMRVEMKEAWAELTHFPKISRNDLMPWTFMVWLAARHNCLLRKFPNFKSDNRDREIALKTREVIDALRKHPTIREGASIPETTLLRELECVAASYEERAGYIDAFFRLARPSTKARVHNAAEIAFVYAMCDSLGRHTGRRRPYILVAILANVAFNVSTNNQWDADRVKHCLRARSLRKVG
jgi:hypothetical protein